MPPLTMPLQSDPPRPTPTESWKAVHHVLNLGIPAIAWCLRRASDYAAGPGRLWSPQDQDYAAALDYLRHATTQRQSQLPF